MASVTAAAAAATKISLPTSSIATHQQQQEHKPLIAKFGKFMIGVSAGVLLAASSASAVTVKLGSDDGGLVFEPSTFSVPAGEEITFINNRSFPHNVVFDEDAVPSGVKVETISHEDYLNGPGESFTVKLQEKGSYKFYCEPHQGALMEGVVTVT